MQKGRVKPKSYKFLTKNFISLFVDKQFMSYALISSLAFFYGMAYLMITPFLFQGVLNLNVSENGFMYIFIAIAFFLGTYSCGIITKHISDNLILIIGISATFVGTMIYLLFHSINFVSIFSVTFGGFVCIFGSGVIMPIANKKCVTNKLNLTGISSSMLSFIRMLIVFILGIPVSMVDKSNLVSLFITYALLSITTFLLFIFTLKKSLQTEPTALPNH